MTETLRIPKPLTQYETVPAQCTQVMAYWELCKEYGRLVNVEIAHRMKRQTAEWIQKERKTWLSSRMVDCVLREADILTDHQRKWGGRPGSYAYHHGGMLILDSHVAVLTQDPKTLRYVMLIQGMGVIPGHEKVGELRFDFRPVGPFAWLIKHTQFTCRKTYGFRKTPVTIGFEFEAGTGTKVPLLGAEERVKRGPGRPRKTTPLIVDDPPGAKTESTMHID